MVVGQDEAQSLKPLSVPPDGAVCIAAVHVNVVPLTVEFNATPVVPRLQIVCDDGDAEPTGVGLTVKVKVLDEPVQVILPTGAVEGTTHIGLFIKVPV